MVAHEKGKKQSKIRLKNVGPIKEAEINLGDLTVLVGPQASGKSIFLQTLKLVADRNHIVGFFDQQNVVFKDDDGRHDPAAFLNGYYGRGMAGMLKRNPSVT